MMDESWWMNIPASSPCQADPSKVCSTQPLRGTDGRKHIARGSHLLFSIPAIRHGISSQIKQVSLVSESVLREP